VRVSTISRGLTVALLGIAAAVAPALSGWTAAAAAGSVALSDPQDATLGADVATVEAAGVGDDRVRFRIAAYEPFARSDAPCLDVQAGLHRDDYRICGSGDVVRSDGDVTTGHVKIGRPSRSIISYTIGPVPIGSPSFYRWRVLVVGDPCPRHLCDAAPDAGFITHQHIVTYDAWGHRLLRELGVSHCANNRVAVVAWEANEGTSAVWNPLATTYAMTGATNYNSFGVKNYVSGPDGLDATRLTIERGFTTYGYGDIVRRLGRCAPPMKTARAIKQSSWCGGCSGGHYVTGLIRPVKRDFAGYGSRLIATAL
jgi:hypothetical protein